VLFTSTCSHYGCQRVGDELEINNVVNKLKHELKTRERAREAET